MDRGLAFDRKDREALVAFAAELVAEESPSGREERAIRLVAERMRALGYDEIRIDGFGNVLGRIGSGGRTVLFDSHVDTVGVDDAKLWAVPPFSGTVRDGFLWGRGSVDMKSGAAASIYAAVLAARAGWTEGNTALVSCTCLEEDCDGENLRHLFREFDLRPDACVVCEPSSNRIMSGHKGKAQVVVRSEGVSAHGAAPEKGVNAVYPMAKVIERVERRNLELSEGPTPRGTLALTRISSESVSLNAVPSSCEIYLDRRIGPGETEEVVRAEFDALVEGTGARWEPGTLRRKTWTGLEVEYVPFHAAWRLPDDTPLAAAFTAARAEVLGPDARGFGFWDFSTNAVSAVRLGIPTIGFGPGDFALAHMRDERCPVAEIEAACEVYARAIRHLFRAGGAAR